MKNLATIRQQLGEGAFYFSLHAYERSVSRNISNIEIREAGANAQRIEDYPEYMMDVCSVCGSTEFREKFVTSCFEIDGKNVRVENVPDRVCLRCGGVIYSAETTERVRLLVHGRALPVRKETLNVFTFA